ncbi:hypothetical protein [uncultured Acidaminococcus sp.]|uniref:hypothetical protein n=1 Tax=uncultured Acidaminococcus sp. TaxID=352152 RepID=UPI0025966DA9|nr:hypothetical protein [uncultured Acidaminococcus sp.]
MLTFVFCVLVIVEIILLLMFFEQRAALDLERQMCVPVRNLVLPSYFNFYWGLKIVNWGCIAFVAYFYDWKFALAWIIGSVLITIVIPVPRYYYNKALGRLDEIAEDYRNAALVKGVDLKLTNRQIIDELTREWELNNNLAELRKNLGITDKDPK